MAMPDVLKTACPECGAPYGEHMIGGAYHPREIKRRPSPQAVRLMHRIRTYGHRTEFALTDEEAALAIDDFGKSR